MTAKTSRSNASDGSQRAVPAAFELISDLPRRQMALATQSASALLRASEALRKVQQQAAQRALQQHEQVTVRLQAPCDFNELMTIQAELMRFNLQEAAQYWQQVTTAALKMQSEMISSSGGAVDAGGEPTLDALQRAFENSLNSETGRGASTSH